MTHPAPRALVAEDEPLLAAELVAQLRAAWPALAVIGSVGDGERAVELSVAERPDVVFLDIRMPVLGGLEAAEAIVEEWPEGEPPPLLVFVTAYDQYAVAAFERAAFDYLLKPVQPERLRQTVERLQAALDDRRRASTPGPATDLASLVERLRDVVRPGAAAAAPIEPLRVIQVGIGNRIRMVPVDDVLVFEAADKYVRVLTADGDHLIRMSLRELLPRLDATRYWQVHRGTVVRAEAIDHAVRDESGRVTLTMRGRPGTIAVSRLHAARFRAM